MAALTGAEQLLKAAVEAGVDTCFANPGARSGLGRRLRRSSIPCMVLHRTTQPPSTRAGSAERHHSSGSSTNLPSNVAGTSEMHFVAALDTAPGMRSVLGLQETVCSGAADGYGRCAQRSAGCYHVLGTFCLVLGSQNIQPGGPSCVELCPVSLPGRMARKPALALLHLGPGLANALANLHNARRAGTPVVNLVGETGVRED